MSKSTLTVYLGPLSELDAAFGRFEVGAGGEYQFEIGDRPAQYTGGDVLLASTAHTTDGAAEQVYLLVGILQECHLSPDRGVLSFRKWERFPVPIVVSSDATDARREDLLGEVAGWRPKVCYLAPDAAAMAQAEARLALRPKLPEPR